MRSVEVGREGLVPDGVAFGVEVQAIVAEELFAGLAVGAEQRRGDVDVAETVVRLREFFHAGIDCLHLRPEFPASDAGFDRQVENARAGEPVAYGAGKSLEVVENAVGRPAGGDVVVAGVEDDGARLVLEDDAVGVVVDVGDRGAAEAAVDDREAREAFGGLPEADAGAADEEDGIARDRILAVPLFEGGDFGFEAGGIGGDRLSANWPGAEELAPVQQGTHAIALNDDGSQRPMSIPNQRRSRYRSASRSLSPGRE